MVLSLHPPWILLSLAVLNYKQPHPWTKIHSINATGHPISLVYCSNIEIQEGPFVNGISSFSAFVLWSSREKWQSQNLVSCEEVWICQCHSSPPVTLCPIPLTLCSRVASTGQRLLPLRKSLLGRVSCGLWTGPGSVWHFLAVVALTGGSWLWLEHCVFWLTQLADKFPGTPGSLTHSSLRLHSYIQESLGQRHWVQSLLPL